MNTNEIYFILPNKEIYFQYKYIQTAFLNSNLLYIYLKMPLMTNLLLFDENIRLIYCLFNNIKFHGGK